MDALLATLAEGDPERDRWLAQIEREQLPYVLDLEREWWRLYESYVRPMVAEAAAETDDLLDWLRRPPGER